MACRGAGLGAGSCLGVAVSVGRNDSDGGEHVAEIQLIGGAEGRKLLLHLPRSQAKELLDTEDGRNLLGGSGHFDTRFVDCGGKVRQGRSSYPRIYRYLPLS